MKRFLVSAAAFALIGAAQAPDAVASPITLGFDVNVTAAYRLSDACVGCPEDSSVPGGTPTAFHVTVGYDGPIWTYSGVGYQEAQYDVIDTIRPTALSSYMQRPSTFDGISISSYTLAYSYEVDPLYGNDKFAEVLDYTHSNGANSIWYEGAELYTVNASLLSNPSTSLGVPGGWQFLQWGYGWTYDPNGAFLGVATGNPDHVAYYFGSATLTDVSGTPVPEPTSMTLLGTGIVGMIARFRLRRTA